MIDQASAYPDIDGRRRVVLDMIACGDEGDITTIRVRITPRVAKALIAQMQTSLAILEETKTP